MLMRCVDRTMCRYPRQHLLKTIGTTTRFDGYWHTSKSHSLSNSPKSPGLTSYSGHQATVSM